MREQLRRFGMSYVEQDVNYKRTRYLVAYAGIRARQLNNDTKLPMFALKSLPPKTEEVDMLQPLRRLYIDDDEVCIAIFFEDGLQQKVFNLSELV